MAKKSPAPKSRSQPEPGKRAAKKVTPKKTVAKKTVAARKITVSKKAVVAPKRTTAEKTAVSPLKAPATKATPKHASGKKPVAAPPPPKAVKETVKQADTTGRKSKPLRKMSPTSTTRSPTGKQSARKPARAKNMTGSIRPVPSKRKTQSSAHAGFTMEEVLEIAKGKEKLAAKDRTKKTPGKATSEKETPNLDDITQEKRVLGAASLADILGYKPGNKTPKKFDEEKVPRKHLRYFRLLLELREHVDSELHLHAKDTLKRSPKEDLGDLSSYSQHAADSATDSFDRDFALSLVSSEQEALHEVDEAIDRIMSGKYGICELTGNPISKERLLAVPFARYSVESQAQVEKSKRRIVQRGAAFADATAADGAAFIQENPDE